MAIQVIVNVDSSTEDGRQIAQRIVAGEAVQVYVNITPAPLPEVIPEQITPIDVERLTIALIERGLTERQAEITILDLQHCSRREIAEKFNIGERTVDYHWMKIYEALGVETRVEVRKILREMQCLVIRPIENEARSVGE